jgi:hypothetical protein
MTGIVTALARPFRQRFLSHQEITDQLEAWARAFPDFVRLQSIGTTVEGRALHLLTIGREPNRERPSVWVDGNMHATELSGSSVALAIAEDFIRLHAEPDFDAQSLPPHVRDALRRVRVYVLPRMCPDGAEAVLTTGRYVRSNPRDRRPNVHRPRWISRDMDGDGLSLLMRKEDPSGEFVESRETPGLMLPRELEDVGPFYKVFPEGVIEGWDGATIPDPYFLGDNDTDLNRNFPWSWAPEPEQEGAGQYPTSEPEARAVVDFVTKQPTIFAWLNLHTFGGCYIRPLGNAPDRKMEPFDLAVFRQVAQWGEEHGGYPTVSGFEEFTYEPDKPLHGALADYAYHQRGAIALVCELWDLFAQLGFKRKKPFVDHYTQLTRQELESLGQWDRTQNQSRIVRPWRTIEHPQLGHVEAGGVDPRVGMSNPPLEQLPEVCARQSAFFLRLAALTPHVTIPEITVEPLGAGLFRVSATITNDGYLPTHVLDSARNLPFNEAPTAVATAHHGAELVDSKSARRAIGHIDGWGRGRFGGSFALFFQRSRGTVSRRVESWVVRGPGTLEIRVESCRLGAVSHTVSIDMPTPSASPTAHGH